MGTYVQALRSNICEQLHVFWTTVWSTDNLRMIFLCDHVFSLRVTLERAS